MPELLHICQPHRKRRICAGRRIYIGPAADHQSERSDKIRKVRKRKLERLPDGSSGRQKAASRVGRDAAFLGSDEPGTMMQAWLYIMTPGQNIERDVALASDKIRRLSGQTDSSSDCSSHRVPARACPKQLCWRALRQPHSLSPGRSGSFPDRREHAARHRLY